MYETDSRTGAHSHFYAACTSGPPHPLRSRGELCVDLRGVNGGLNAIPLPAGASRPTGSTRATAPMIVMTGSRRLKLLSAAIPTMAVMK